MSLFCKRCGSENDDDYKFCKICGQSLTETEPPIDNTFSEKIYGETKEDIEIFAGKNSHKILSKFYTLLSE